MKTFEYGKIYLSFYRIRKLFSNYFQKDQKTTKIYEFQIENSVYRKC